MKILYAAEYKKYFIVNCNELCELQGKYYYNDVDSLMNDWFSINIFDIKWTSKNDEWFEAYDFVPVLSFDEDDFREDLIDRHPEYFL
jgi:hypothetical protein